MPVSLDDFDRRLLEALQEDADQSTAALGDAVGLSQGPCWRRIQRLKEAGVIRKQVALLDREALGLQLQLFVHVKLSAHGRANVSAFLDAVARYPEVLECHVLLGAVDVLLRVVCHDMKAYETFFFEHLSRLPGVTEVISMVSVHEAKATTALPLQRTAEGRASRVGSAKRRSGSRHPVRSNGGR
jgi:Lrp/AsnC family transcriptional regulator